MLLIIVIDLIVVGSLIVVTLRKGFEESLPYFVFFTVLLPEESRIRLPGAFDLYTHRIALVVLLTLFLICRRKPGIRTVPLKNLIYTHIAWALFSTVFSIVFTTSLKQLLAQVFEYYLLYYIILKTVTSVRTISRILFAMIAAMSVCSVFGLLDIYVHWSILSIFPAELQLTYGSANMLYSDLYDRGIRARSTFPHPILFGAAIAMTIPFALHLVSTPLKSRSQKIFLNISLLLMFWSLYKSGSRGPWIATALAMVILTLAAKTKIRKRVMSVALLAVAVLIIRPGVAQTLVNMYVASFDSGSHMGSSLNYRPALFRTVKATFNEHPERALLGYGLGSFRDKGLIIEMPGIETHRWYTCDSTWILFWYEGGYIGVLILGTLLLRPAVLAYHSFRRLPAPDRTLSLVFLSSIVAFYMVMISVAIYGWGQNGFMLWTVIATSIAYTNLKQDELRRRTVATPLTFAQGRKTEPTSRWLGRPSSTSLHPVSTSDNRPPRFMGRNQCH